MNGYNLGKIIFFSGIFITFVGLLIWLFSKIGLPLGRFPGDIQVQKGNVRLFFPLLTSVLISIFLTIVINVVLRLFEK